MKQEIFYRAIHRQVLIVYVVTTPSGPRGGASWSGRWAAYCVPVAGSSHAKEAETWRTAGTKLGEAEARAFWPALIDDLDKRIYWNP